MKQFNLRLPHELKKEVQKRCIDSDISVNSLMVKLLEEWLVKG